MHNRYKNTIPSKDQTLKAPIIPHVQIKNSTGKKWSNLRRCDNVLGSAIDVHLIKNESGLIARIYWKLIPWKDSSALWQIRFFFYFAGCLATLLTRKNPHRVTWQIHRARYTQSDLADTYIHTYIHDGSLLVRRAWPSLIKSIGFEFDIDRWIDGDFEASRRLTLFAG